jgi:hypothetical protein
MTPRLHTPSFDNLGSLITYDGDQALGYLMDFTGKGVYDASLGRVPIEPHRARAHNEALDKAMLEGLDKNCELKQGGSFYYVRKDGTEQVVTFMGTVVADSSNTAKVGRVITFKRAGKVYRGIEQRDGDIFNFKRIS